MGICQFRPWTASHEKPVHMFCDARSTPPRVAAVLYRCALSCDCFHGTQHLLLLRHRSFAYCDIKPPEVILNAFMCRGDNQITSLEILSIALGISTFAKEIEGRNLIIWSDSMGAESATRKGVAFVDCCLVSIISQTLGACTCRFYKAVRPELFNTRNVEEARRPERECLGGSSADKE